jgi:hypothetical protein
MAEIVATVSVKVPIAGGKPARDELEHAARLLEEFGFEVTRIGRFGVSIKGEDSNFVRVLGVSPRRGEALSVAANPTDRRLRELVNQIEVVPDAQLY